MYIGKARKFTKIILLFIMNNKTKQNFTTQVL